MSEGPNPPHSAASPPTGGDAGPKRSLPLPNDEDDRVIITRGEDFRLYQRSIWQILDDGGWASFVVIGVLAMAIVGILITLFS